MENRSSLFNALITLTLIAILAVLACFFKMRSKRQSSTVAPDRRDTVSSPVSDRGAGPDGGRYHQPMPPSAPVRSTGGPAPAAKPLPVGPTGGASAYEILVGCTFLREEGSSGSRFRISHQGREVGIQLYHVESPELPPRRPGLVRTNLPADGAYGETMEERAYFDARDFTRSLLSGVPFHVYTVWESTGNPNEYFGFVFVLDREPVRRHWLSELLVAGGHAQLRPTQAVAPDNTSARDFATRLQRVLDRSRTRRVGGVF